MPTVVDSLIVLLNLDPTKFNDGQKKALEQLRKTRENAESEGKKIESAGTTAAAFFDRLASAALKFGAALYGGIKIRDFTEDTIRSGAALGRLAYATGASTEEMSLWVQAAREVGGTGAETAQSLFGLSQNIQEFALTGQSNIIPFFRAMHVGLTDTNGHVKSLSRLLLDLADYAQKAGPQNAARTEFMLRAIGLDQDTINLIIRGRRAVEDYLEQARKVGAINEQSSRSFQALEKSWASFTGELTTGGRTFLEEIAKPLEYVLDLFTRVFHFLNTHGTLGNTLQKEGDEPVAPRNSRMSFFGLTQHNENSAASAISPAGAIGRNQILPSTAAQYGFDPTRLNEPAYNDMVARAIEGDLFRRYHGDIEAMTIAYHNGPGAADRWLASGRNDALLGPQTRAYLARERGAAGAGATAVEINGDIIIQAKDTSDPKTLAERFPPALRTALANQNASLVTQANIGPQ